MSHLVIKGGGRLRGEAGIQGAKNSVLPILAATLLTADEVELRSCPRLRDVDASVHILRGLGCEVHWEGADTLLVDTRDVDACSISDRLCREMRSSAIFLGAVLARCAQAELSYPGGCELGPRPIDLHLSGLRALGAEIDDAGGVLHCRAPRLRGREIVLSLPSVGATENLMLAACAAAGTTTIANAAREPEIVDLQGFLNACGARVSGAGTSTVCVEGGRPLHGCTYTVMPDRIAAATYLCAAASAGGEIFLRGAKEEHLSTVTAVLREAGCSVLSDGAGIACACEGRLSAVRPVRTAPYPGFPTDAQALLMAALLRSRGATVFEENLFSSRYRHVDELTRMGADVRVSGRVAVVYGVEDLHGAPVRCTDLRGGAALCVAALAAEGETTVREIGHIDRGYEDIARDLRALGADIVRRPDGESVWDA
nr:UDP-N-acetylglucosamine 1-carboxyvinyltransferase [uncultured Oscillibacter sp.]